MIFSRRRGGDTRDTATETPPPATPPVAEDSGTTAAPDSDPQRPEAEPVAAGPVDLADAPAMEKALDLGALRIPMYDGVEARVQADPEGRVQQIALVMGDNALQLAVLAAPRTESVWDEIRGEIRGQLRAEGFASNEIEGPHGTELCTRVRTPDGPLDLRFVGVSGPRWLVRAIFQGPVAVDATAAPLLQTCLAGLVVDRGREAMPVGESLPLRLPREVAERASQQQTEQQRTSTDSGEPDGEGGSRPPRASQRRRQSQRRR